ncbi:MAG: OmpA/MotB domain protein [Gammaproteobacteria bacterium]|nr:OmpA/MotB domain protein [Gammaproteobacteria bacterium]
MRTLETSPTEIPIRCGNATRSLLKVLPSARVAGVEVDARRRRRRTVPQWASSLKSAAQRQIPSYQFSGKVACNVSRVKSVSNEMRLTWRPDHSNDYGKHMYVRALTPPAIACTLAFLIGEHLCAARSADRCIEANVRRQTVNTTEHIEVNRRRTLVATAVALILVVVYTAVPIRPESAAAARPEGDKELAAHSVYLASRKVSTAGALAETRFAQLQGQLDLLHARPADHGVVLTLGDVLFTSGRADLKRDAIGNLNKLVNFLARYPDRSVAIHGYSDGLGNEQYNQGLSERRAHSVRAYLAGQGIDSTRLSASGMGQSDPVAGNDSGAGRQQNRRVEVIISNPPAALTQRARTAKMIVFLALLESISGNPGRPLL